MIWKREVNSEVGKFADNTKLLKTVTTGEEENGSILIRFFWCKTGINLDLVAFTPDLHWCMQDQKLVNKHVYKS